MGDMRGESALQHFERLEILRGCRVRHQLRAIQEKNGVYLKRWGACQPGGGQQGREASKRHRRVLPPSLCHRTRDNVHI